MFEEIRDQYRPSNMTISRGSKLLAEHRIRPTARLRSAAFAVLGVSAILASLLAATDGSAIADTSPAPTTGLPATFGATPLPTMQVNGIVWAQVTVGNTVYATGNFSHSRPAGAAPNTQLSPAGNIVAFDITTGERIASFNHTLNGAGRSIAASPDGTRIYVGGDFSEVDGVPRGHLAAFNTSDGSLVQNFAVKTGSTVTAIVATQTMVYVGGSLASAGVVGGSDIARTNLAAFTPEGSLSSWAPTASGGSVLSLVLSPDMSKLIVGGHFNSINGTEAKGMGAVDAATGATLTWLANSSIKNSGPASIMGLSTDGVLIYGGGSTPSVTMGNFEGRFALDPADGSIVWLNACLGDTYDTLPVNGALYSVGHNHDCTAIGAHNDNSLPGMRWHDALAESTFATGVNLPSGYAPSWNFAGTPSASLLNWFPSITGAQRSLAEMPAGTVGISGAAQAAWSITSNTAGTYLALGGEFVQANYKTQQGLVRFAVPAISNTSGPVYASVEPPIITPDVAPGAALVQWNAAWDRDSESLTYEIFRDGLTTPLTRQVMASTFWRKSATGNLVDQGLTAGPHAYILKVSDPSGNWVKKTVTVMVAANGTAPAATTNLALGKPTATSGLHAASFESWRAVDGNTDGNPWAGSMAIARLSPQSWWQVDLLESTPLESVTVFGRTDGAFDQSADYWVFISGAPLDTRLTATQMAAQPGVWSSYQQAGANPQTTLPLPAGTAGRYVMVRQNGTNALALAEVQVAGVSVAPPIVDTLAPTVPGGVTAVQAGTAVTINWTASTDLPDPGGVGVSGYYVIRDYTTQWFVPAGTLTYTDTTVTPGKHRYQVRAVDKGSRISPASTTVTLTVTDPNAVVDTLAPTVPSAVTAVQAGTAVNVNWSASTDLPDP
ncbi:MAG TPA: hypothetical protein DEG43_09840, partial [Acidimicrobiaceae bacterium]|nr:hypothetical protein [Acidimicrobiaceae bacterium]